LSIKLASVSKYYGAQAAVKDLSFEAYPNEILGVLGPNGAGKSTTMKMICGYLPQDAGSIEMNGEQIQSDPIKFKSQIGYLPESNPLYLDMYVREFLLFCAGVHQIDDKKKRIDEVIEMTGLGVREFLLFCAGVHQIDDKKKRIDEVIEMTGLGQEQHKTINQLSKGYRQRVGLAQAILHDPQVLVLDEPTSGLDPNQLVEIRQLIKDLGREKTVLFSSHILQEVQQICDRIIVLNQGELVANSTIEDLNTFQEYTSLVLVSFEKEIEIQKYLNQIPLDLIHQTSRSSYEIKSNEADQLKKELFDIAVAQQNRITALNESTSSFEDIFQSLTKSDL